MAFSMFASLANTGFREGNAEGPRKFAAGSGVAHNYAHRQPRANPPKRKTQLRPYFGGCGAVKISRLRPGSGFGFGLGAFLVSFLPLSLFPMKASMTQKREREKPRLTGHAGLPRTA
jgi:hypothetical protein